MTYDNTDEAKVPARRHGFRMRLISMTNTTHHAIMKKPVVGKDLTWMNGHPVARDPLVAYRTKNHEKTARKRASDFRLPFPTP